MSKFNILIISMHNDIHTDAVKYAIERKGALASVLCMEDYPHKKYHNFLVQDEQKTPHFFIQNDEGVCEITDNTFDVVWYRRPLAPKVNRNTLHEEDAIVVERLARLHSRSLLQSLKLCNPFWVNRIESAELSDSKMSQLSVAKEVGLGFPNTLISNNPDEIRAFIESNLPGKTIYKDICSVSWFTVTEKPLVSRTQPITVEQLPDDDLIRVTSGIYQPAIEKEFEIRTVIMGRQCYSVKIDSQATNIGKLDWRNIPASEMKDTLTQFELPEVIIEQCYQLMDRLGIYFGCFDFIYTRKGEFIFLEVNEQGQFLWMEYFLPELPLLDCFVEFLLSKNKHFKYAANKENQVSYASLLEDDQFLALLNYE